MSKTLVCIIAQTRSHEITWKNFNKNVLNELGADLALCIGVTKNYDYKNPFWENAKYKWTNEEYGDDYTDAFNYAQTEILKNLKTREHNDWKILLDVKNFWLGGIKDFTKGDKTHLNHFKEWKKDRVGSSSILIFYRWLLLKKLKEEKLIDKYDRFIITRSDFFWPIKHPPLSSMSLNNLWIPDGEGYGGYCDRYALVSKKDIVDYLSLIEPILTEPKKLFNLMKNKDNWNLERYIKLYFKIKKLDKKTKFFPYIMYTVFSDPNKTGEFKEYSDINLEWMKTIYSKDKYSKIHEYIVKKPSEYLSSIIYSVIFERKGMWGSFILFKIKYLFFLTLLLFNKKKLFSLFVKKTTKIDWDIINDQLKRFSKRKNFKNYIVNKHYF
jgi:hypothetical protein